MEDHDETESYASSGSDGGDSSSLAELAADLDAAASVTEQSHDVTDTDHSSDDSGSPRGSSLSDLAASVRGKRSGTSGGVADDTSPPTWAFTDATSDSGPFDAEVELDPEAEALLEDVADETHVLLVGPTGSAMARTLCERLLGPVSPLNRHRQLVVTVDTPPDEQRELLRAIRSDDVESQVLVDAQSYAVSETADYEDHVEVLNVSSARDLRRIGILTTKVLTEWRGTDASSTVCLHSLSALLAAVDETERVFRFVHILQERVRAADARSHFYLDPSRHDEQTIRTFFSLFETILEFDADGALRRL